MRIYLVRAIERDDDGQALWWSNEGGWAGLDEALVWTANEMATLKPPQGGEWVAFGEVGA